MTSFDDTLPLGRNTGYAETYDPTLLRPVPRRIKREEIGIEGESPFTGFDIWNAYELSWLNPRGKPVVAMGEFRFPCESANLIESKSFKLYLNSFNQTCFEDLIQVQRILAEDLGRIAGSEVSVRLVGAADFGGQRLYSLPGESIDDLDIEISSYALDPALLDDAADTASVVSETVHSHLLKSNCLVTGQPDWGSILIRYEGPRIDRASLLRYLVSFRRHNEFHEQCVERVFIDLLRACRPDRLTVHARYTRRGGLDINPFRSNFEQEIPNLRLARQ